MNWTVLNSDDDSPRNFLFVCCYRSPFSLFTCLFRMSVYLFKVCLFMNEHNAAYIETATTSIRVEWAEIQKGCQTDFATRKLTKSRFFSNDRYLPFRARKRDFPKNHFRGAKIANWSFSMSDIRFAAWESNW